MKGIEIKKFREKYNLTQEEFSEIVKKKISTIRSWEQGSRNIPQSAIELMRIFEQEHNEYMEEQNWESNSKQEEESENYIPLLPISAMGGNLGDFSQGVSLWECEKIISPIKEAQFAITVTGYSMEPEYPNGAKVFVKKIDHKAFIEWGSVFVLDTCNGVVLKKVMPTENDKEIMACSINKEFPPYRVKIEDIYGFYKVLMCLSLK